WYARADVRHTSFAALAVLTMVTLWRVDYRLLDVGRRLPVVPAAVLGVAFACGLVVFVPGIGKSIGGHARWLRVGPAQYAIGFQPSELIKITLVVFLATWLARSGTDKRAFFKTFVPAAALIGACVAVVITQGFGAAVVIALAAAVTLLLAGVPWYYLASLIPPAAGAFYLLVVRCEHRWQRITAMLDPQSATNPSAYQPKQALLAVMTGGWWGKGLGAGVQKLGYLPEDSTDFIFSVYCEEFGFLGAVLMVGLLLVWIWQASKAVKVAGDDQGRLLAGSLGFLVAAQAVLHVAVDTGAAPPTGASLPFISAGGTALVLVAGAVALMVSVTAHPRPT
ncbi:MAG: FtsW/RodA/SpoVE family cell cycle protein, partial [Phycisphaerae bacterium]|nr:FtsW/RodA/SpoVE family cell cycle protein [Phycisphaerae bacterium]